MTEIIKDYITHKKIRYEILTGTIKSQDRPIVYKRFNEDNDFGVFLQTTRAGGLSINITNERVVVIYNSDWNPQNDL
jgi:SNF2 family DNA or RNA helicase